jgi:hypothetical protein
MENYKNADGVTDGAKSGGAGAIAGALGGAVITTVISGMFAKGENEKALKLQKELAQLSLAQQKQLEERLQDVKSETERQGMIYQFLAVQNNNEMINRVKSKRYTSYIVLGVGVTILALVVLKLSKK